MSDNICIRCKINLAVNPDEGLCRECIDKTVKYSELYYDTKYLARIMGVGERTTRRRAYAYQIPGTIYDGSRYIFKKNVIDEWDKAGQSVPFIPENPITPIIPPAPTNPLQEEAAVRCRKKDHSWLSDPKYDGIAYTSEETTVEQTEYTVLAGYERTCYFCKYSTFVLA
ncbi:hypothetical protein ACFLYF_01275 [Chloroflexota bacterium]